MQKQLGFTFVELLVVIAVIGILTTITVYKSPTIVNSKSLVSEAEVLASKVSYLLAKARASQSTVQLVCNTQTITANFYNGARSNTLSIGAASPVSLDAKVQTASLSHQDQLVFSGNNKISLQCPTACGDIYITSDGHLLSSAACGAFDFIFTNNSSSDVSTKLSLSNLGYPRIYVKSASLSNNWNELLK